MTASGHAWAEVAAQDGGSGTWANAAYAQGANNNQRATWTNSSANATGGFKLTHFWPQHNMLGGTRPASINSVTITVWNYCNNTTYISGLTVQLIGSVSGALGSPVTLTRTTSTSNSQTITFDTNVPNWADVADLGVKFVITHNNSTSQGIWYCDAVDMVIDYTSLVANNKVATLKSLGDADLDHDAWHAWPNWPTTNGTQMVFTSVTGSGTWEYMVSTEPFDVLESAIFMKISKAAQTPDLWWGLNSVTLPFPVSGGADQFPRQIYFRISGNGNLDMIVESNWALPNPQVSHGSVTYNATNHAYMRLRQTGSNMYWDASADGITWDTLATSAMTTLPTSFTYWYPFVRCSAGASIGNNLISCINILPGRRSGYVARDLGSGSGTWTDPECAGDTNNGAYASWTVPA